MRVRFVKCVLLGIALLMPYSARAQTAAPVEVCPVEYCYGDMNYGAGSCCLPYAPSWTGFYIGGHGGYGWCSCGTQFDPLPNAVAFVNLRPVELHPNPQGWFAGIQAGYNFQWNHFVVGFEADFSFGDIVGDRVVTPIIRNNGTPLPGAGFLQAKQRTDWFGSVRPRIGVISNCYLFYFTGGFAFGHTQYHGETDLRPAVNAHFPVKFSTARVGWTVGGGLEYAFSNRWSWKFEYLYFDLGDVSRTGDRIPLSAAAPFQVRYTFETREHLLCVGLNYRFRCW